MKIIKSDSFVHNKKGSELRKNQPFLPFRDTKVQIKLNDAIVIEAATFERKGKWGNDVHACISTQAGCKFGCRFCKSGKKGFQRNLSCEEILMEVDLLAKNIGIEKFNHLVYMGIGEPLDNFDNVAASIGKLNENNGYAGNISLATVGIPDNLNRLSEAKLQLEMVWISLHAATNEKRAQLMPIAKIHDIRNVIAASQSFSSASKTKTWMNYMLLNGFNDSMDDAKLLKNLLLGTDDQLSVFITVPNGKIPGYTPCKSSDIARFESYLASLNMKNRIFKMVALGRNVKAGCGEFIFKPA